MIIKQFNRNTRFDIRDRSRDEEHIIIECESGRIINVEQDSYGGVDITVRAGTHAYVIAFSDVHVGSPPRVYDFNYPDNDPVEP